MRFLPLRLPARQRPAPPGLWVRLWSAWRSFGSGGDHDDKLTGYLLLIGQQEAGNRSGRIEPRAAKRQPKTYPLLFIAARTSLRLRQSTPWPTAPGKPPGLQ